MFEDREISLNSELESAQRFPNLLTDKDFVSYNWTLPFCSL